MKHHATEPRGFLAVVGTVALSLAAAGVPSALYPTYRHEYGLSHLAQTSLFATYAVALFPALLLGGRILRRWSGPMVIMAGVALVIIADLVFSHDATVVELFVARAIQGVGIGLINAAAGVLALTTRSDANPRQAALGTALATALGLAMGVLGSGVWLRIGPRPTFWPYVVHAATSLIMVAVVATSIRPVAAQLGDSSPTGGTAPPEHAARSLRTACAAVFIAWGYGGLLLAVLPDLTGHLSGSATAWGPVLLALMFLSVAIAEGTAATSLSPVRGLSIGLVLLATGGSILVIALVVGRIVLLSAGSAVLGIGLGATFVSGIAVANTAIPPERREVLLPLFYACVFGGNAVPAVLTGYLAGHLPFMAAVSVVSVGLAVGAVGLRAGVPTHKAVR